MSSDLRIVLRAEPFGQRLPFRCALLGIERDWRRLCRWLSAAGTGEPEDLSGQFTGCPVVPGLLGNGTAAWY